MGENPIHSTGRGGAGNIGPDPIAYVDGSVVREGTEGEATSGGRGGAGNIHAAQSDGPNKSEQVVPEPAMKVVGAGKDGEGYEDYHTGRGGQGNVHRDKFGGHSKAQPGQEGYKESLLDKAKHAVGLDKQKAEEKK